MIRETARRAASSPRALLCALLVGFVAMLAIHWPGELTPDSVSQLQQARSGHLTDWHPPLMAVIWMLSPQPATMLLIQAALHWLGIGCLAATLWSRGSRRGAWAMVGLGFTPIALKYVGIIQTDSLLAALFIAAFGMGQWSRFGAAVLGGAGSLVRMNGVFALPPLLAWLWRPRTGPATTFAFSLLGAAVLIPAAMLVDHDILRAQRTGVERTLQNYDLAGIAAYSGDDAVLPVPIDHLGRCYTPLYWDTLGQARCGLAFERLPASISGAWLRGIVRHPLAYAEHRISHFNREIFFLVPAMQQCVDAPEQHRCDMSRRGYVVDFVAKNALLWPVTWLVVGLILLLSRPEPFTRDLCLSGLTYGAAYLIVGVAADFRYFFWTELAVQAALVMHLGNGGRLPARALVFALGTVLLAGYAARYAPLIVHA